jgi:hypothetical protein
MARRKMAKAQAAKDVEARRCTITLSLDQSIRLGVYAARHKLTRSQAAAQAVADLVRGIRIGFGDPAGREDGSAA